MAEVGFIATAASKTRISPCTSRRRRKTDPSPMWACTPCSSHAIAARYACSASASRPRSLRALPRVVCAITRSGARRSTPSHSSRASSAFPRVHMYHARWTRRTGSTPAASARACLRATRSSSSRPSCFAITANAPQASTDRGSREVASSREAAAAGRSAFCANTFARLTRHRACRGGIAAAARSVSVAPSKSCSRTRAAATASSSSTCFPAMRISRITLGAPPGLVQSTIWSR